MFDSSLPPAAENALGTITLVGAGPGDPELLTLKALRALQSADIVYFDDLVAPEILDLLPRRARCVYAGKPHGTATISQDDIIAQIIASARAGYHVVRLKSGDPMIFGRGGEEVEAADAAGIPTRVIPGITAAAGAAASTRIPLTHRKVSAQVSFITAVRRDGSLTDVGGLAGPGKTLVVYMGSARAAALSAALRADDVAETWPVAIIENATRPTERIVVSTVAQMAQDVGREAIRSPALIVIGEVVADYRSGAYDSHGASLAPVEATR